ncbi:alanine/glycine:cation symporter family protein [Saccharopolyspora hordei]|uniref:alanine/glycine:cation symporter family protein n=1 Tax=Saccharopolyspora hordei TaxID=1838 RepID=UPI0031EB1442
MATKFVECTLGVKYREIDADGVVSGGPMHYLRKGIAERIPNAFGASLGKVLSVLAAIMILFFAIAGGNMFQANQTFAQLRDVTRRRHRPARLRRRGAGLRRPAGGADRRGDHRRDQVHRRVTSRLVPAMAVIYVLAGLTVIGVNYDAVPGAVGDIISGAFTPEAGFGGLIGVLIVGFQRAAFSNEAGLGSAPIAHSAVKTKHPVTEGLVALLEPFIDTVVVVLHHDGADHRHRQDAVLDRRAADGAQRRRHPGRRHGDLGVLRDRAAVFPYVLTLAVALFAISTIITWGYYGQRAWLYLFGKSKAKERVYNVLFCVFTVVGSVLTLGSVLDFADAVLFALALFNIIGLYIMIPVVKRELAAYREKLRTGRSESSRSSDDPPHRTCAPHRDRTTPGRGAAVNHPPRA